MAGMTRKERARKLHHDLDYILTHDKRGAAAVRRVIEGIAGAIRTPQLHNYKTEAADRVRRSWLYPYAE